MTERSNSNIRSRGMSDTNKETDGSSMNLLWSHEKLVKAAWIALNQHFHSSEKVPGSSGFNHQNLYWSDENNMNHIFLKNENDDHNPSLDEYIHRIPSDNKVQKGSTLNDTCKSVQILDNDIMHLASIAAYTALSVTRGKEHDDDDETERRKRRKTESVLTSSLHLESPSSRLQRDSQFPISSTQAVCKTNSHISEARFSQPSYVNRETVNATTTTTSYSSDIVEEWDRMLDERPSTSDIAGLTQWLLKLYALSAPQSSKAAVTTLSSPSA